jgi:hypothetical protein
MPTEWQLQAHGSASPLALQPGMLAMAGAACSMPHLPCVHAPLARLLLTDSPVNGRLMLPGELRVFLKGDA